MSVWNSNTEIVSNTEAPYEVLDPSDVSVATGTHSAGPGKISTISLALPERNDPDLGTWYLINLLYDGGAQSVIPFWKPYPEDIPIVSNRSNNPSTLTFTPFSDRSGTVTVVGPAGVNFNTELARCTLVYGSGKRTVIVPTVAGSLGEWELFFTPLIAGSLGEWELFSLHVIEGTVGEWELFDSPGLVGGTFGTWVLFP